MPADLHPREVVEARIGERHDRIQPVRRRPFPGLFHGLRIRDRDGADRSCRLQRTPPNARLLIVRDERAADCGRRAADVDRHLSGEVQFGEIVVSDVRRRQSVAGEDERGLDERRSSARRLIVTSDPNWSTPRCRPAQVPRAIGPRDASPRECDALKETLRTGRLQARPSK